MKHTTLALLSAASLAFPTAAQAESFLDRIDRAVSKVESTMDRTERSINRTENTAERLNKKIPEAGAANPAPQQTNPSSAGLTAEEQIILDKAKRIEEERILREAEEIKFRRSVR